MNKFLSLVLMNIKMGLSSLGGMNSFRKKKKRNSMGRGILYFIILLVALSPSIYMFGQMGYNAIMQEVSQGSTGALNYIFGLTSIMLIVIAFIYTPAIYFFANDLENLLTMPLRPGYIIASKFVAVLSSQYMMSAMFLGAFLAGGLIAQFSLVRLFASIYALIMVPIFPTALVSILLLIFMQVLPFFRDKNKLSMVTGIIAIIFSLGIGFFAGSVNYSQGNPDVIEGSNIFSKVGNFFPTMPAVEKLFYGQGSKDFLFGFLLLLMISLLALAIFFVIADKLYLRIARAIMGSSSKSKNLSDQERSERISRGKSPIRSLMEREFQTIMGTPSYFLNGALPSLLMPFFIIAMGAFSIIRTGVLDSFDLRAIRDFAAAIIEENSDLEVIIGILGGGAIGILSSYVGLSTSAISRDAKNLDTLKSFPIRARDYFYSKIWVNIGFCLPSFAFFFILFLVLLPLKPLIFLLLIVSFFAIAYAVNMMEMFLDILRPKLDWEDETKVMKNNSNIMISSFINMGILGVLVALYFLLGGSLMHYLIGVLIFFILLSGILTFILMNRAEKIWLRINA